VNFTSIERLKALASLQRPCDLFLASAFKRPRLSAVCF
jgi:hypothetical protein